MQIVFFIFAFGVMVSLLVAKGIMLAHEHTGLELEQEENKKLFGDLKD